MSCADAIAMSDRRQPLHRGAEQAPERFSFCLAQLRIFGRNVRDRAVMLAELLTGGDTSVPACPHRGGRGGIAVSGQGLRQRPDLTASRCGVDDRPVFDFELGHLTAGKLGHSLGSSTLGEEAKRAGRQIVVGVLERAAASVGDREDTGWPTASAVAVHPRGLALDHAAFQQLVKVTPDSRWREAERAAKGGSTHWPVLQDQPGDTGTGALLSTDVFSAHVFHNISVP